jgi:GNAT superfamily N-acetyltransferase
MTNCPPGPWQADGPGASPVVLAERSPAHPDAARLLAGFYAEQVGRYGWAEPVDLDPAAYADPCGRFVLAYAGEPAVGCGGWRWHDHATGTVEIKKLYVVPAARGIGTGRALLAWLEAQAAGAGARRVILETGVRNTAAQGLFAAAGYLPVPRYVPGRDPAINRAFAHSLDSDD